MQDLITTFSEHQAELRLSQGLMTRHFRRRLSLRLRLYRYLVSKRVSRLLFRGQPPV